MKLLGFLFLCASGFGIGQLALNRAILRRRCIEEGIELLAFVEREIRYTAATPEMIFSRTADTGTAPHYSCRSFQNTELPDCFTAGERRYFQDSICQIGHLPTRQTEQLLEQLTQWLETLLETQQEVCRQGLKLYRQLGLCGGLGLAILLL